MPKHTPKERSKRRGGGKKDFSTKVNESLRKMFPRKKKAKGKGKRKATGKKLK